MKGLGMMICAASFNPYYRGRIYQKVDRALLIEGGYSHRRRGLCSVFCVGFCLRLRALLVDAARAWMEGIAFYCEEGGIWLADAVPVQYLNVMDA